MNNEFKAIMVNKNGERLIIFNGNKRSFNTKQDAFDAIVEHSKEFNYPLDTKTLKVTNKSYIIRYEIFGRQVTEWEQF